MPSKVKVTGSDLMARARRVKLIVLDVDGVMTDGRIVVSDNGSQIKNFDVRDGLGIVLARKAGLKTAILTAEASRAVSLRARKLKVDWVKQLARDKAEAFSQCLKFFRLTASQAAYIGDDLVDLPVLTKAGLSATVPEASPEVRRRSHYVTSQGGGCGAVREFIELILKAKGRWAGLVEGYLERGS